MGNSLTKAERIEISEKSLDELLLYCDALTLPTIGKNHKFLINDKKRMALHFLKPVR